MKKYFLLCLLFGSILACNDTNKVESHTTPNTKTTENPQNEQATSGSIEQLTRGKELFLQNCAACHGIKEPIIGPALKGTNQKYAQDKKWLYEYIRDNQKLVREGDAKAIALSKSNPSAMNAFTFLTNEEIEAILAFAN